MPGAGVLALIPALYCIAGCYQVWKRKSTILSIPRYVVLPPVTYSAETRICGRRSLGVELPQFKQRWLLPIEHMSTLLFVRWYVHERCKVLTWASLSMTIASCANVDVGRVRTHTLIGSRPICIRGVQWGSSQEAPCLWRHRRFEKLIYESWSLCRHDSDY